MLGLYCVAWLMQESVSSRIFVRKKSMSHISPTDVHSRRLPQGSERRNRASSAATTRFPRASCFWETLAFCSRNMGAHVQCTYAKKLVSSNISKLLEVTTKIRETCEKTLFTPSSPAKATKLYRFCLSDKRSPKSLKSPKGIACLAIVIKAREHLAIVHRQVASIYWAIKYFSNHIRFFSDRWSPKGIACLVIDCCKIASKDLAIRHSQITRWLLSKFWSPNCHCLFSDKRVQNCQIYLAIISSRSPVIISNIRTPNG